MWQRSGRAARAPGTEAVAVLFAESKYFDNEKEKVAKAAEARAVKAAAKVVGSEKVKRPHDVGGAAGAPAAKRQRVAGDQPTVTKNTSQTVSHSPSSAQTHGEAEMLTIYEQLRITYHTRHHHNVADSDVTSPTSSSNEPQPEMDAFINAATRPGATYRLPIMAYYENDRRSMWTLLV